MAESIESRILLALRTTLTAGTSFPVVLPTDTEIPRDSDYITFGITYAPPRRVYVKNGQPQDRQGTLIVTLVQDLGQDQAVYTEEAAAVAALYPEGSCHSYSGVAVEVYAVPHIQEGYRDQGNWRTPVTVRWRTFA